MVRRQWKKGFLLKSSGRGQQNCSQQEDKLVFQVEASVRKARLPFEEMKGSLVARVESSWGEDWGEMKSKSEVAGRGGV